MSLEAAHARQYGRAVVATAIYGGETLLNSKGDIGLTTVDGVMMAGHWKGQKEHIGGKKREI